MKFTVQATPAPRPKSKNIRPIAIVLVAIFTVMAVAQLFTYERFADVLNAYDLPGGVATATIAAAWLVVAEVAAIPFLLGMRLSPLARMTGVIAGWLVVIGWLKLSVWGVFTGNTPDNVGIFGDTLVLPGGWWIVFFMAALGVLVAWVSWGMWPSGKRQS
jgi:hypothetical protein